MRIGLLPGQAEALRAAYAEQRRRLTRRGLFLAVGSSAFAGACGFAAGNATASPSPPTSMRIHGIALGPLEDLRQHAMHIAAALEATPSDPVLGVAYQRLVSLSLTRVEDEELARRLATLAALPGMPDHIVEGGALLRAARKR